MCDQIVRMRAYIRTYAHTCVVVGPCLHAFHTLTEKCDAQLTLRVHVRRRNCTHTPNDKLHTERKKYATHIYQRRMTSETPTSCITIRIFTSGILCYHVYTCMCHVHTCIYAQCYTVHVYICVHVCIMYMYVCVYVCVYMYVCIHAYIHQSI